MVLNLVVALQETVALAAHWLAEAGLDVPQSYREIHLDLAARGLIPRSLAERLAAVAGFRNLVAHRYGLLDPRRVHEMAPPTLGTSSSSARSWPVQRGILNRDSREAVGGRPAAPRRRPSSMVQMDYGPPSSGSVA